MSVIVTTKIVYTLSSSKNSTSLLFEGKSKFIHICHFCKRLGHIFPKCFEYQNTFKMGRFRNHYHNLRDSTYKPRDVSRHKIDLKNNNIKKIWIKNQI